MEMRVEYELVDTIKNNIGTVNIYRIADLTEEERKQRMDRFHKRLAEILIEDERRASRAR